MAQLKDSLVQGSLRVTDKIFTNNINITSLTASKAIVADADKNITTEDLAVTDSNASTAATTTFVQSVTQSSTGKISVTKANLNTGGTWSGTTTYATTTTETNDILYPIGVTSGATTTLKRNTSITMDGGKLSINAMLVAGNFTIAGTKDTTAGKTIACNSTLYLKTSESAPIIFQTDSTDRCRIDATGHFRPESNNNAYLGTSSIRWKTGYFSTSIEIGTADKEITATDAAGVQITPEVITQNSLATGGGFRLKYKNISAASLSVQQIGSTSAGGITALVVGNALNSTTNYNSRGTIELYSANTAKHIIDTTSTTTERIHTLPDSSGTIAHTDSNITGTAANVTGTVEIANGGTGISTIAAHKVLIGPSSGTDAPTWRTIAANDLPTAAANVLGVMSVSTGLSVSSGAVSVAYGTGAGKAVQGNQKLVTLNGSDKTAASIASFYAPTSAGTSGQYLKSTAGTPEWATFSPSTVGLDNVTNDAQVKAISSTDNVIVRFDGTEGQVKGSRMSINDNGLVELSYKGRYPGYFQLKNKSGTLVAEYYYDTGNADNVTTGKYFWRQYSPKATADTGTSGHYESYQLPTVATGLTEEKRYTIITTKNLSSITTVGTISSGTWQGTEIAVGYGGTGTSTAPTANGVIYASSTSAYASTAAGTAGHIFVSGGANAAPKWSANAYIIDESGSSVKNKRNELVLGNATESGSNGSSFGRLALYSENTAGTYLVSASGTAWKTATLQAKDGTIAYTTDITTAIEGLDSTLPTGSAASKTLTALTITDGKMTAATFTDISIGAGAISSGTVAVARGGTNIGSYTKGDILYASAGTTLSKLAISATEGAVLNVASGIPAWTTNYTTNELVWYANSTTSTYYYITTDYASTAEHWFYGTIIGTRDKTSGSTSICTFQIHTDASGNVDHAQYNDRDFLITNFRVHKDSNNKIIISLTVTNRYSEMRMRLYADNSASYLNYAKSVTTTPPTVSSTYSGIPYWNLTPTNMQYYRGKWGNANTVCMTTNGSIGFPAFAYKNYHLGSSNSFGVPASAVLIETTTNGTASSPTWTTGTSELYTDEAKRDIFAFGTTVLPVANLPATDYWRRSSDGVPFTASGTNGTHYRPNIAVGMGIRVTADFTVFLRYLYFSVIEARWQSYYHTTTCKIETYNTANNTWTLIYSEDIVNTDTTRYYHLGTEKYVRGNRATNTTDISKVRWTMVVKTLNTDAVPDNARYAPCIGGFNLYGYGMPSNDNSISSRFAYEMARHGQPIYVTSYTAGDGLGAARVPTQDLYIGDDLRNTAANKEKWANLILGNEKNVNTTDYHSQGRIYIYSAETAAHVIVGSSTNTEFTHTLPNATGTIAHVNTTADNTHPLYLAGFNSNDTVTLRRNTSITITGGILTAEKVYNAVWNDYAECRNSWISEPGRVITEDRSGTMELATQRLMPACKVVSDTYGTLMGESETAKTPIAVAGRVLVYPYKDPSQYQLGDAVCSAPNGTVDIMSRDEIMMFPERIIGTVSEIPKYEVWHAGTKDNPTDIEVNGRIWIYVR